MIAKKSGENIWECVRKILVKSTGECYIFLRKIFAAKSA
jgi:hypothetical protein